jgi:hypothetical protein
MMGERRFPAPWTVEEYRGISYIVRDANNFPVAYVYFESEPGRRAAAKLMTKDEARKIAAGIAKLPELLGVEQREGGNSLFQRRPYSRSATSTLKLGGALDCPSEPNAALT